jgi:hypothetical protein
MNHNKCAVLISVCMFLANAVWCTAKEETASPEALISRARLQEQIWTEGMPPMSMRADIQVFDVKGALVHGDYTLDWVSPSRWREVIRFGNYERVRVGDAKGYLQKSGLGYRPEIIFRLDIMLNVRDTLRVQSKQTLGKVRSREKARVREKCTEVKRKASTDRTMCFDEANGALVRVEYLKGENQQPPEISRIEYGAFKTVGGKLIPYEIRALKDLNVIAIIRVTEVANLTEENLALFNVPMNAEFWARCDDMQEAELIAPVYPSYPIVSRTNREQGKVIFYAVVEADGSLSHLTLIHGATPLLEAAAAGAIRKRRYKPAACGQIPIRVETSIATDFSIQE